MLDQVFYERSDDLKVAVQWYDEDENRVQQSTVRANVLTTAHYSVELDALIVDQETEVSPQWLKDALLWSLPDRRTLETHASAAAAIRRTVVLADDYAAMLACTVFDDARTDAQVRQDFDAKYGPRMAF